MIQGNLFFHPWPNIIADFRQGMPIHDLLFNDNRQDCFNPDTQEHIVRCPTYQTFRFGKDLNNDKDLVDYISKVIKIRGKEDNENN